MVADEQSQEMGRDGVAKVKQWLEATTFMELQWNAYEDPGMCVLSCLGGLKKKFDLTGSFIGSNRYPIAVESKNHTDVNDQHRAYREFLAIAYSNTMFELQTKGVDLGREFIWATKHPFFISGWKKLATRQKMLEALEEFPQYLGEETEVDDEMVRSLCDKIWVLVWNEKQENITLTHDELMKVLQTLGRKAPTL